LTLGGRVFPARLRLSAVGVLSLLPWSLPMEAASAPMAVVVAPQRAGETMSVAELNLIFLRKHLYWPDGARLQPVNLPAGHPLRNTFSQAVLGLDPDRLDEFWKDQYFHGIRPPYVLDSEEAVLRFVAETPNAIGYVDACRSDERVAVLGWVDAEARWLRPDPAHWCARPAP
jgi:hypothetical protein